MNSRHVFKCIAGWSSVPIFVLAISAALGIRVSTAGGHRALLSADLAVHEARHSARRVRVIVHGTPAEVRDLAERRHLTVARQLDEIAVVLANSDELTDLAADGVVDQLSGDLPVRHAMSISNASTGAAHARAGERGPLGIGGIPAATGQGIGIAILDSGIATHAALKNVVASVSFVTGDPSPRDAYGHGTHVAGIVAGSAAAGANVTGLFDGGIAPGAQLVNVRVLGADGTGLTSDVIAGMEWVIANRTQYNIRVINLSLGHAVTEPSATDPLCQEVAKAVAAGIVVVTAAGNSGRAPDGSPALGSIDSPGNSPFAITVGALNTWQTVGRSDDSVTTYSSRGPTRYDLAVKPDVAAPGNKIVSLEAAGSYLATNFAVLHVAGSGENSYMRLSGTSMAAPMVSGAVALLLQGHQNLVPAQVKMALQSGATYLPEAGLFGAGAGSVDVWASRKVAINGLAALPGQLGGLGLGASGVVFWDTGTLSNRLYGGVGMRLLPLLELPLDWLNPSRLPWGTLNLVGPVNTLSAIAPNPLLWGEVASWTTSDHIMWGDAIDNPEGQHIMWGDSDTSEDYHIMWGDSVTTSPDPQ